MFEADSPRILQQLREAIATGDGESLEQTAHLLKGSASNFAAAEVVRLAQRLERLGRESDFHEARHVYPFLEEAISHFRAALDEWSAVHLV